MTLPVRYVEVAVIRPVNKTYTYSVPDLMADAILVGKRVLVPFGRRTVTGVILGTAVPEGCFKVRRILDMLDPFPLFPPEMVGFFRWIADYYLHPIGEVIKCALPAGLTRNDREVLVLTDAGRAELGNPLSPPVEARLLQKLADGPCSYPKLQDGQNGLFPQILIQTLERQGWIQRQKEWVASSEFAKTSLHARINPQAVLPPKLSAARRRLFEVLKEKGEMPVNALKEYAATAPNLIRSMAGQGLVEITEKEVYRDPFGEPITPDLPHPLTDEQANVVSSVAASLGKGFSAFLLAGVTGSGKTEVYMHLARAALEKGLEVVVLVPEIALISQMERRFRARFGEQVAVLHSGLSKGERFDQWMRILRKEASIVVGARSAIFAPFKNIGLIIVDEEHDTSYKQGSDLLYNARDMAVVRARLSQTVALLGSATPSVQSLYNTRINKFKKLVLTKRVEKRALPEITVVDLRKQRDVRGARRFIGPDFHRAMTETLEKGDQVLLFLNRRGFASLPVCAECGEALRCKHCDITLTFHKLSGSYQCHYCEYTQAAPCHCPVCGSAHIKLLGMGTEKLEHAVNALFPEARVARMDRDTTRRKGSVLKILKGLQNGHIDVLIGTQMVAKGHDFPNITLVGVVCADLSLNFPDFRAGERTFQLLAQVAGRAGRGKRPGRVILQTYAPDHFSIAAAKAQDVDAFYRTEIEFRKVLAYPPFSRIIQLKITGKDAGKTHDTARNLKFACEELKRLAPDFYKNVEILGPIESPIAKIADHFRWQMLLKGVEVVALRKLMRKLMKEYSSLFQQKGARITVDVDPFFMM